MDRDDSDNGSPKELSSFDVAKMTQAEVAAEIAQRMTRWRRARNRADRAEGMPPVDRPAAPQTLAGQPGAVVTPAAPAIAGPAVGALSDHAAARMERALRLAARKTARRLPIIDAPAESSAIEVAAQPELENRADQAGGHPHAIARSDRRSPIRWVVISAAVVAAGVLAVAIFLPLAQAPPPQVASRAEAPPADAGASALRAPAPEARAPQQAPPATAPLPTPLAALLPARTKPASKLPTLAARLKPDGTAAAKPSPSPVVEPPLPSAPQAPPPRAEPQHKPAPPTAHETGKDDDLNDLFEMMFSDGVAQ